MGQDEIYLQVIESSGEGKEQLYARKVLRLLKRGKHWVLVTLLLGNVITNETLPIILDRSLGGGWPAVLGSTVLIGRLYFTIYWGMWLMKESHLRRDRSAVDMRPVRPSNWSLDVTIRSWTHVDHVSSCLAYCKTPRQNPR